MSGTATNKAAWLDATGSSFRIDNAPLPTPGPDDIVIQNRAVAINPVDPMQQKRGYLVKKLPWILGNDVAGVVHAVGSNAASKFKVGDRVAGAAWGILTGKPENQGFQHYTLVPARSAAVVPDKVDFKEAAVLPLAIGTATAGLFRKAPYLELPYPTSNPKSTGKTIVVYGGSSSVGATAIQLAVAAGVRVIATTSPRNFDFVRSVGASEVFDYKSPTLVDEVVKAIGDKASFAGIYDAISESSTYEHCYAIIEAIGSGRVVITHQAPQDVPDGVQMTMVFGIGEFVFPVWENFVGGALASGQLQAVPKPVVAGKGLENLHTALDKMEAGVSAQKIVVEL